MTTTQRKLATILAADAAGYSRLMGDDDKATVQTLTDYRLVFTEHITRHQGRVVDTAGDSVLAVFESPVEALECSVDIQRELARRNRQLAEHRRMLFRIGLNLGDVITREDGTVYGDGVNIAARLQSVAEPGGICISANVYDQVESHLPLAYADIGEQQVKNISKPVRAYRVAAGTSAPAPMRLKSKTNRTVWISSAIALMVIVGVALVGTQLRNSPSSSQTSVAAPAKDATGVVPALPEGPSIAVLAFQNMSGKPEEDWFVDGMIETLTTDLSRLKNLLVIARNSSFTYKGKPVDVRQVGRELGVRYVLEGSVQRTDQRLRINAQLVETQTGRHLWAERYDRKVDDVFDIQDDITQHIVTELQVALLEGEQARVWRKTTRNREAYDLYLRGREHQVRYNRDDMARAQTLHEQALDLDPKFTMAMVWLGWTHYQQGDSGWSPDSTESYLKAVALPRKAIAIDPSLGDAYVMLANTLSILGHYAEAIAAAERAIVVSPNQADTLLLAAWAFAPNGRAKEAIPLAQRAFRLNPYPPDWYYAALGDSLLFANQVEEALPVHAKCVEKLPDFMVCRLALIVSSAESGKLQEAITHANEALRINPKITAADNTYTKSTGNPPDRARVEMAFRLAGLK
ncbi:MAG: adenylate/guanylate cyclase domain-containing protein [Burkholderiales bacterium]